MNTWGVCLCECEWSRRHQAPLTCIQLRQCLFSLFPPSSFSVAFGSAGSFLISWKLLHRKSICRLRSEQRFEAPGLYILMPSWRLFSHGLNSWTIFSFWKPEEVASELRKPHFHGTWHIQNTYVLIYLSTLFYRKRIKVLQHPFLSLWKWSSWFVPDGWLQRVFFSPQGKTENLSTRKMDHGPQSRFFSVSQNITVWDLSGRLP